MTNKGQKRQCRYVLVNVSPCIAQKYNKMKEVEAEEQVMSEESNDEGTLLRVGCD